MAHGRTAGEGDLTGSGCEQPGVYGNSEARRPDVNGSVGERRPSVGSETDGTEGAGLTSQVDVQARGEVLGLAHSHESRSEFQPGQRRLRGCLILSTARHVSEVRCLQLPGFQFAWSMPLIAGAAGKRPARFIFGAMSLLSVRHSGRPFGQMGRTNGGCAPRCSRAASTRP